MKIAIVVNLTKQKAIACANRIIRLLSDEGARLLMPEDCKPHFQNADLSFYPLKTLFSQADAAVTVGGDGTIIHAAKYAALSNTPLVGVNVGRLGFAADIEAQDTEVLKRLLTGEYETERRLLLDVEVVNSAGTKRFLAVNDAVVTHGTFSKIVDLSLSLNGELISKYRADGLLFSTPTGSTAYSLSAGGPIISPQMQCILMTPVCPHSLFSRSVLFEDTSDLSVTVKIPSGCSCVLSIDGEANININEDDVIHIKKSETVLTLISVYKRNFYRKLNEKLKEREL